MKRIISLFSLFILLFVNIVTPVTYAMDGEDFSSESVSESTESSVDTDNSVEESDDSSDTDASDDVSEPDADSESAEDTDADVTDEESSDEEVSDSTEGEELEESLENSASSSTDGDTSEEEVSAEEEIELLCKQEGAPENAHYLSSDDDASDMSCKWECDNHYALSEDGLSCVLVEESSESVVTDSKGNSEEVKSCEIPENAQKIESTGEKCEWECSQGYLITKAGDSCEEINFSKYKNEPSVDALCYKLGLSWAEEKGDLAKLAGIDDYVGSREQNESIRLFLVDHVEEILKGKFNIHKEIVKSENAAIYGEKGLNLEVIKGEATYNGVTVKVVAPEGSFPEGTWVSIDTIENSSEVEAKENELVNKIDEVKKETTFSFDISFYGKDDVEKLKELQPEEGKEVSVVFDYAANEEFKNAAREDNTELKVYHLEEKNNSTIVKAKEIKDIKTIEELVENVSQEHQEEVETVSVDSIGVEANSFSMYVLTLVTNENKSAKLTLETDGGELTDNSYVCYMDAPIPGCVKTIMGQNDLIVVLPDAVKTGFTFLGWYNGDTRIGGKGDNFSLSSGENYMLSAKWFEGPAVAVVGTEGYTGLEEAYNAVTEGDSVILLANITIPSMLNIEKDITINLNGFKLARNDGNSIVQIIKDATLTIDGTSENSEVYGRINVGYATNDNGNIVLNGGYYHCTGNQTVLHVNGTCRNSNVTINNAEIVSPYDNGIQLNGAGEFLIKGSKIKGKTALYIKAGNLKIEGSLVESSANGNTPYSYNGNGSNPTGDAIVVDTCLYPGGAPKVILGEGNTITVSSEVNKQVGYYEYNTTSEGFASAEIKATSSDNSVTEGYVWEKQSDDSYKLVQVENYVAEINGTLYTTLEEAVSGANDGNTIKLLTGVILSNPVDVDKTVTIELNGYSITPNNSFPVGKDYLIGVKRGANLTINDSSTGKTGKIDVLEKSNIYTAIKMTLADEGENGEPAQLNINGGTFIGYYYAISGNGSRNNTIINIETGSFSAVAPGDSLAIYHPQNGILTINNGTFEGYSTAIEIRAGTLIVNGGTFTSTASSFSCNPNASGTTTVGAAIAIAQHTTKQNLTGVINGGTFNGQVALNVGNPQGNGGPTPSLNISNGEFNGVEKDIDVQNGAYEQAVEKFVSGGTFTHQVLENFCAEGYLPTTIPNTNGKYSVTPEYTYQFDVDGVIISGGNVVSGATITGVIPEENKQGFTFSGWTLNGNDVEFPLTVTGNITLMVKWKANTNTPYKVKYYFQGFDGHYPQAKYEQPLSGETDTIAYADTGVKFTGFTLNPKFYKSKLSGNINGSGDLELKLYYTRNSYTVTFDSDSGSTVAPITAKYKSGINLPVPTKTGYDFKGWGDEYLSGSYTVTTGVNFVAKWAPKKASYTLNYRAQKKSASGDELIKSITITGQVGDLFPTAEQLLEFTGMTLRDEIANYQIIIPGDATLPGANNVIDIYYNRDVKTINLDANGGEVNPTVLTGKYQGLVLYNKAEPVPQRSGYDFDGWYSGDNEFVLNSGTRFSIDDTITLIAHWTARNDTLYTVEYYLQNLDGTFPTTASASDILSGTTNSGTQAIAKFFTGFTLTGDIEQQTISETGATVVRIEYSRDSNEVEYNIDGDIPTGVTIPSTGSYKYEEEFTVADVLNATGYEFTGWFLDEKLTGGTIKMPAKKVTFTGWFTEKTDTPYTYHYELENLDGSGFDSIDGPANLSGTTNAPITVSEDLDNLFTGFTLSGTKADYTGNTINADGSTDVAIYYTRNSHNVRYAYENADSLTSIPSALPGEKSYKYGQNVSVAYDATASGYTFSWNTGDFIMPDEDVVITGTFASGTADYTVTYYYQDENGEYLIASGSIKRNATTDTEVNVTDDDKISQDSGYVFTESGSVLTGTVRGDGTLELKVLFKGVYTVKYLPGDDSLLWSYAKTGLDYGSTTPIFPYNMDWLEKPYGYIFDKWTPVINPIVTGNIEYVAQWAPKETTYTVEYYQENLSGDYELTNSETLTGKTKELVTGDINIYSGFTYTGDLSTQTGEVEGNGNLILKLYYTRNSHTFTYTDPNGNPVEKTVKYGEDVSDETTEYEGYIFSGYTTDVPTLMPDSDLNVTPIWNLKEYTVSFNENGGAAVEDMTYTIKNGISTGSLPTPIWTGYEFTGWFDSNDIKVEFISTGTTGDITLTAKWNALEAEYKVTHYKEVWEGYKNAIKVDEKWYKVDNSSTGLDLVNTPISVEPKLYSGFTFDTTASNVTSGNVAADGSLELKLYYKRNVYEVSFNTSGGNTITGQEVGYYRPIEIPADPIKTGYTFKEWQLNGVTFTGDDWKQLKTPGNIEIVATWTANSYSVKFDTTGASGNIAQIDTKYDEEIVLPNPTEEQLSKTGYEFTGWSIISGGNIDYTGGVSVNGLTAADEITLYPVWEAKNYTITWKNSDGSIIKTGSYAYDTIPELGFTPVDPAENIKCDFKGWTGIVEKVSGDAEYTAEYDNHSCSIAQYKVSWLNSDGSLINENQVTYGTKASYTGEVPTSGENIQYHYEFTGWILSGDTEETVLKDTELPNVESDLTFIAAYDPVLNNYTITFAYTGANGFVTETGSYAYGTQTGDLTIPEVTGYVDDINVHNFSGWTPELTKVEGDATYTAVYNQVLRNYIVTWNIGGEETPITGEYSYQGKMVVPENPTRTGYTFSNWEAQDNAPEAKNGEYVKGDYTYVAKWNANTYKIEFNPNGGNGAAVLQDMTYDLTGTLTGNTFERNGYEFTGWSETESGVVKYADNAEVINLASTGIVKLYAQRSALDYTIKYNVNSGTMPGTYTGKYSILTGIDPLAEPTRTGYVFSGWFDNEELTGDKVESIPSGLSGDTELWAKWTPITYTIVFDKNENEATGTIENKVAKYDSGVNLPEIGFTWTGYYINEWNTESNGSGKSYNPGDAVMNLTGVDGAEVKLYAQWMSQYTITVSFDTNGGTEIEPTTGNYNTIFEAPTNNPTKTGYNFSGWTLNGELFDFSTKITGDIILTGVWSPINYPIYYTLNSGDNNTGNVNLYTVEDKVSLYNATRSGYVFEGWYSGDNKIVSIEKGTTGTGYLTAQWKLVSEAIDEAKAGDKHPVVSSDVEIDVVAATGDADYTTSGSIPSGTGILLNTVVGSGIVETYSLVGLETTSPSELNVKAEDLVTKSGYVATIVGGLDVFIKKITTDTDGNIIKTGRNTASVNFSKPVALPIHIKTSATNVEIRVNHGDGYGLSGLSTDPNTTCTNGIASILYTGGLIPVENGYAWIYTCSASTFVAYTEAPKSNGGGSSSGGSGGGGGGGSSSSSSSANTANSPKGRNTTNIDLKGVVITPNKDCLNITEESKIKYSDEVLDAYAWAYANGVVTSNDVEKARVYSYITRAELAKIMVQYVAGVLKKKPVVEGNVSYADVDESLGEYAGYINLAYQYQIMGINADGTPLKEFGPKSLVTRAEFASVLSRVLYGDKYNVDGSTFYSMHIDVLNQLGIIKDTNPAILEKIGGILIMLKRASKDIPNTKDASNVEYCPITTEDEQKAAYEWALKYGITSIDDPDKARLGEELTRAEFAKMMVQYMINVLHKKPILNKDISYPDVDGSLGDLEAYIKLAYQYQIMGIHGNGQPLEEFAPNRIVTRKEFATVFSRILFGDRFNIDGPEYWTNHIDALKEISVLKDGNPALQEVRGRVMLMMYRSADDLNK